MPQIEESIVCAAPALTVWKLLYDPVRFAEWWSALDRTEPTPDGAIGYSDRHPGVEFPLVIDALESNAWGERSGLLIRCRLTGWTWTWTLQPHPDGCRVTVHVEAPDATEPELTAGRADMRRSLPLLAALSEASRPHSAGSAGLFRGVKPR